MWILRILAFNLTLVLMIELSVAFFMGAKSIKKIVTVALANVITNPAVVLSSIYITLFHGKWENICVLILETLVVLTEGFLFSKFVEFDKKNPYFTSLVLNFVSYSVGEIINLFL